MTLVFLIVFAHVHTCKDRKLSHKNINSAKITCNIRTHTKPEMRILKWEHL